MAVYDISASYSSRLLVPQSLPVPTLPLLHRPHPSPSHLSMLNVKGWKKSSFRLLCSPPPQPWAFCILPSFTHIKRPKWQPIEHGVRQMQTADLQTRAWVSQTRTSVSQTSASYRYRYIGIGIGIFNNYSMSAHWI